MGFGTWQNIGNLYLNSYNKWIRFPRKGQTGIYRLSYSGQLNRVKSSGWFRPVYIAGVSSMNQFATRIYPQSGNKLIRISIPEELGFDVRLGFQVKRICRLRDKETDKPWFVRLDYLVNSNQTQLERIESKVELLL
jgi:hypothetical protein